MTETWIAPIRAPWSNGERTAKRSDHRKQDVSEATIKFALETFDAALQYFHEHEMEEFDLDYQPKIPGVYGPYESGGDLIQLRVLQAVDDLSEVTPALVQRVIAANTPPLPELDAVPGLIEWAVTHVRAHMIRQAMTLIHRWFREECTDDESKRLIGDTIVEIGKRHLYEIDAPLAAWLINVVVGLVDDSTREAFFDWIRNNERSDQWMIWRVNGEYWYDDNQEINYGPRPETKSN